MMDWLHDFENWLMDQPFLVALPIMLFCVLIAIGTPVALIAAPFIWAAERQPKFELFKAEWECVASHQVYVPGMWTGKVYIAPHTETICDEYNRRAA